MAALPDLGFVQVFELPTGDTRLLHLLLNQHVDLQGPWELSFDDDGDLYLFDAADNIFQPDDTMLDALLIQPNGELLHIQRADGAQFLMDPEIIQDHQ